MKKYLINGNSKSEGIMFLLIMFISSANAQPVILTAEQQKDPRNTTKEDIVYKPNWRSLDSRPLPSWYDDARIGIMIHWGIYSVPAYPKCPNVGSEWFWYRWIAGEKDISEFMTDNFDANFTYQDFAPLFTANQFDATEWAKLFYKSGARYVVLTAKHHDGYCLFPCKRKFNSNVVGPGFDIVGVLAKAVRDLDLKFGVYYSLYEWFNPMLDSDKHNGRNHYIKKVILPDINQLVNDYKVSVLWTDVDNDLNHTYWNAKEIMTWLYNESPVKDEIVVNDRWGAGTNCKHGDFYTCSDRYNPGHATNYKFENVISLDRKSWGYREDLNVSDVLSIKELIHTVVTTVSCGGNVLINIGPTKEGTIPKIFKERLLELGKWLQFNGRAIYNVRNWFVQSDSSNPNIMYACGHFNYRYGTMEVYAYFLKWPEDSVIFLRDLVQHVTDKTIVKILGHDLKLEWEITDLGLEVQLPELKDVYSDHAWVLAVGLSDSFFPHSVNGYRSIIKR